jgi:sec-independent protein translocase protein TatA
MPNVGPLEIALVLIIVLVIFGPKRLPEMGRSLGKGIRQFKSAVTHDDDDEPETIEKASEEQPLEGEVVQDRRA